MNPRVVMSLPTEDRRRSYDFYRGLGFEPIGNEAEDGVPEPLQFRLDTNTSLMFIPTGGFGWVLGGRDVAAPESSECVLSLRLEDAQAVRACVQRIAAFGGTVITEPSQQDWGFSAVAADPDGHVWQLIADPVVAD